MNIGIFFNRYPKDTQEGTGYLYNDAPQFRNYPHELLHELEYFAEKAVVVCKEETYQGNNAFSRYWVPDPQHKGIFVPVKQPITLDVMFDKGHFKGKGGFAIVNVPALAALGRDKVAQYQLFGEFQPQTFFAANEEEFMKALNNVQSQKAVIKPINLNGGRGIMIDSKTALRGQYQAFPEGTLVIQQFIDSSAGITGLTNAVHDLRLYIINGEAVFASVRTPKAGSLVANTSQGGSIRFFAIEAIPTEPVAIAAKVDTYMQQFGNRFYSVDFVNNGKEWYVLEINDRPGIPARFQSPAVSILHQKLASCIARAVHNPINRL